MDRLKNEQKIYKTQSTLTFNSFSTFYVFANNIKHSIFVKDTIII